jgi:hypothetical protein
MVRVISDVAGSSPLASAMTWTALSMRRMRGSSSGSARISLARLARCVAAARLRSSSGSSAALPSRQTAVLNNSWARKPATVPRSYAA